MTTATILPLISPLAPFVCGNMLDCTRPVLMLSASCPFISLEIVTWCSKIVTRWLDYLVSADGLNVACIGVVVGLSLDATRRLMLTCLLSALQKKKCTREVWCRLWGKTWTWMMRPQFRTAFTIFFCFLTVLLTFWPILKSGSARSCLSMDSESRRARDYLEIDNALTFLGFQLVSVMGCSYKWHHNSLTIRGVAFNLQPLNCIRLSLNVCSFK